MSAALPHMVREEPESAALGRVSVFVDPHTSVVTGWSSKARFFPSYGLMGSHLVLFFGTVQCHRPGFLR
jgi:hypothetical protein